MPVTGEKSIAEAIGGALRAVCCLSDAQFSVENGLRMRVAAVLEGSLRAVAFLATHERRVSCPSVFRTAISIP